MPYVYIHQHAHDIAFAVFRVAALVRHPKLKGELEDAAVDLIAKMDIYIVHEGNECKGNKHFYYHERLKWLVRLSESVGEMKSINAAVLCREIDNLEAAIVEAVNTLNNIEEDDIDLDNEEFASLETISEERLIESPRDTEEFISSVDTAQEINIGGIEMEQQEEKEERVMIAEKEGNHSEKKNVQVTLQPEERQEKVMKTIRQMPNGCRMRDLMIIFPKVSERTLRNDLQTLVKQGAIERFGSQGPYSYFRVVTKSEVFAL
ncbi:MAG: hypothetical protein V1652_00815 [bacterium]